MTESPTSWLHIRPTDTSLPLPSKVHQIDALQMMRAVAVILVLWCHSGQMLADYHSKGLPGLGVFGIDVFFVISGFILSLSVIKKPGKPGLSNAWDFTKRRLIRIFPMYWLFLSLALLRMALSHHILDHNYLTAIFLLPDPRYPNDWLIFGLAWTLIFEIFFYYILGLILLRTTRRAVPTLITLLVFAACCSHFINICHPFWIIACNPILLEFVFGAFLALLYERFGRRRRLGILLTLAGVVATFCMPLLHGFTIANGLQMVLTDNGVFARVFTWGICAALIVGGVIFWSPSMESRAGKWWVLMGNSSYSTYVAQSLVIEFGTRLYFKVLTPPHSIGLRLTYEIYNSALILAAGFVAYILIEKPLLRVLQNKFLRKKRIAEPAPIKFRGADHPLIQPSEPE